MARIRIVDEWLRSPASPPTRWRSIMVIAEQWGEQRVLMRAYAECMDQTRPTIVLHGTELAIGPAGTDPHGAWGIHVHPQIDGRAQEIAEALRQAAKRMAGSKASPPRLADEQSDFDRKRTDNWSPGTPRATASDSRPYFEPMVAASQSGAPVYQSQFEQPAYASSYDQAAMVAQQQAATYIPVQAAPSYVPASGMPVAPAMVAAAPANPLQRLTPLPVPVQPSASDSTTRRRRGWTSPIQTQSAEPGGRTALGYESGAGAQSAIVRLGLRPSASSRLGRIVDRSVPPEFEIGATERDVLNALGEQDYVTAYAIGQLIGHPDPVSWMEALIRKLNAVGLDIVSYAGALGGEPTYRMQ